MDSFKGTCAQAKTSAQHWNYHHEVGWGRGYIAPFNGAFVTGDVTLVVHLQYVAVRNRPGLLPLLADFNVGDGMRPRVAFNLGYAL